MLEAAPVKAGLLAEAEELGTDPEDDGILPEDEAPAPGVDEAEPSLPEEVGMAGAELASSERPERLVGEAPSTGGTEMGWPAEEHWETTMLETAVFLLLVLVFGIACDGWQRTRLVFHAAGLAHTRSDGLDEFRLLAVAGKVCQGRAAIAGQGINEAVGLL